MAAFRSVKHAAASFLSLISLVDSSADGTQELSTDTASPRLRARFCPTTSCGLPAIPTPKFTSRARVALCRAPCCDRAKLDIGYQRSTFGAGVVVRADLLT